MGEIDSVLVLDSVQPGQQPHAQTLPVRHMANLPTLAWFSLVNLHLIIFHMECLGRGFGTSPVPRLWVTGGQLNFSCYQVADKYILYNIMIMLYIYIYYIYKYLLVVADYRDPCRYNYMVCMILPAIIVCRILKPPQHDLAAMPQNPKMNKNMFSFCSLGWGPILVSHGRKALMKCTWILMWRPRGSCLRRARAPRLSSRVAHQCHACGWHQPSSASYV